MVGPLVDGIGGKENRPARRLDDLEDGTEGRKGQGKDSQPSERRIVRIGCLSWFSPFSLSCSFYFVMTSFYSWTIHRRDRRGFRYRIHTR